MFSRFFPLFLLAFGLASNDLFTIVLSFTWTACRVQYMWLTRLNITGKWSMFYSCSTAAQLFLDWSASSAPFSNDVSFIFMNIAIVENISDTSHPHTPKKKTKRFNGSISINLLRKERKKEILNSNVPFIFVVVICRLLARENAASDKRFNRWLWNSTFVNTDCAWAILSLLFPLAPKFRSWMATRFCWRTPPESATNVEVRAPPRDYLTS